jgi:hypothetical protein
MRAEIDRSSALQNMINSLQQSTLISNEQKQIYQANLEQLARIRFTQKSMSDPHVIEEYDKACAELVGELTILSISAAQLQPVAEELAGYSESTEHLRRYYDSVALEFNAFLKLNSSDLSLDTNLQLEQKPLFWSVSHR